MLQFPTNVSLQNKTIDATALAKGNLTFYGDRLSGVACRITDYGTGEIVLYKFYNRMDYEVYNGEGADFVRIEPDTLVNGHDYIFEILLTQYKENGDLIYDMPVTGGTVMYTESLTMFIENNISAIYPWDLSEGERTPTAYNEITIAEMAIKINGETRKITSYDPNFAAGDNVYGKITIDSPFTQTSMIAGKQYEIYSNHIVTPQYYLKCRDLPNVTLTNYFYDVRIHTDGEYSQLQNVGIKYYTLSLYWANNTDFWDRTSGDVTWISELVDETPKIYSQKIEADFYVPYRHDENYNNNEAPDYYKVVCNLVTNDNVEYSVTSEVITKNIFQSKRAGNNLYAFDLRYDEERGRVLYKLRGYGSSGGYTDVSQHEIFRKDMGTGEIVQLPLNPLFEENEGSFHLGFTYCDATASVNSTYRYAMRGVNTSGEIVIPNLETNPESPDYYKGIGKFPCNDITVKDYAYYISDLNFWYSANRKTAYKVGDVWRLSGDISDTTVVNNLDRQMHINYNQYTSATSTETNYMSGTLSALLGYVNCTTHEYVDDIALIKAWRKFITQPKPFLLKSQKGDVWVVNIIDNPQTEYQENSIMLPTRITFSWAETCSVNDVQIVDFYGAE